jgi:predicted exporter
MSAVRNIPPACRLLRTGAAYYAVLQSKGNETGSVAATAKLLLLMLLLLLLLLLCTVMSHCSGLMMTSGCRHRFVRVRSLESSSVLGRD